MGFAKTIKTKEESQKHNGAPIGSLVIEDELSDEELARLSSLKTSKDATDDLPF